jgi:hypothetical protein
MDDVIGVLRENGYKQIYFTRDKNGNINEVQVFQCGLLLQDSMKSIADLFNKRDFKIWLNPNSETVYISGEPTRTHGKNE